MNKALEPTRKLNDKYTRLNNLLKFNFALYSVCSKSLKRHKAIQTDDKELAENCRKAGFLVTLDFDNKTFVVAEV